MGDRQSQRLRLLARERDDLSNLFRTERRWRSRAVVITENVDDEHFELGVRDRQQLCSGQPVHLTRPPIAPTAYALRVDAKSLRLVDAELAVSRHRDDAGPLDDPLLLGRRPPEPHEDRELSGEEENLGGATGHAQP